MQEEDDKKVAGIPLDSVFKEWHGLPRERPDFVVDWDGTCVEEKWPEQGDWLPGAAASLRLLAELGTVVVYSLRCSPLEYEIDSLRPRVAVEIERRGIRKKLDEAGLHDVILWPNHLGKPPGQFYIDDRGVTFRGDWGEVMGEIRRRRNGV